MKILVVEDEKSLADSICQYLNAHFYCEYAGDFISAQNRLDAIDYDCVILDIGLPGGNGLDLLQTLKADRKGEGVLIISAKNSLDDKVTGLQMGADDYLTKPFHLSELNARVNAIIRRRSFAGSNSLVFDLLSVDTQKKTLAANDKSVDLTRKEYELLLYFITNKTRVISKTAIADHLWEDMSGDVDSYDFIYTHIKNLRRKLVTAGCPDYIQSIYGMGYKFRIP